MPSSSIFASDFTGNASGSLSFATSSDFLFLPLLEGFVGFFLAAFRGESLPASLSVSIVSCKTSNELPQFEHICKPHTFDLKLPCFFGPSDGPASEFSTSLLRETGFAFTRSCFSSRSSAFGRFFGVAEPPASDFLFALAVELGFGFAGLTSLTSSFCFVTFVSLALL